MTELTGLNSYQIITCVHHSRRFNLYQASKTDNNQELLIKTPDPARSLDAELISSLKAEADCGKALSHPRIRAVFGYQQDANAAFLIGEYIPGKSLAWSLEQNPDLETALFWLQDILEALVHAHSRGIYHMNLNPHNIMIDEEQHAKLIGFGKSKTAYLNREDTFYLYHPILFVAPEQYQAGICHAASDLYSVAALAYLMICGVPPWRIDLQLSHEQQKQQSLCRAVIMPERLNKVIPDWLFGIILQCLKLDPHLRLESAEQMLQAILSQGASLISESDEAASDTVAEIAVEQSVETIEPTAVEEANDPVEPVEPISEILETIAESSEPLAEDISLAFAELSEELTSPEPDIIALESIFTIPTDVERQIPKLQIEAEELELMPEPILPEKTEKPLPQPSPPAKQPQILPEEKKAYPKAPVASPYAHSRNYSSPHSSSAEPEEQETKKLQGTFKLLLWISLIVALFVVFKYFVLEPRPKFSAKPEEPEAIEQIAPPGEENAPLSLIAVAADTLVLGSISPEADDDEFPLLTVSVAAFYISPREITQREWLMVFPDNPAQFKDLDLPVENVSFYDVIEFCNAKSIKDGYQPCYDYYDTEVICNFSADGYRLPTEAEWEFAAKAKQRREFQVYSGSDVADEAGWHNGNSNAASHAGGKKQANKLGLYDLSGNLFEWVWNWYAPYSYRHDDPRVGPATGTDKVIRGGSWYHSATEMRVTNRSFSKPYTKSGYIGFRVVRSSLN